MVSKTYFLVFTTSVFLSSICGKAIENATEQLLVGPVDLNAKVGQNVTMQCQWSKPSPNCYWLKDEFRVELIENERYTVLGSNETKNCSLVIIGIQPADEGDWQCVYSPERSTLVSKPVKLIVDDTDFRSLMAFQVQPEETNVVNGKDVTLQCKFTTHAPLCFWAKDGDLIAVRGRYRFVGDRFKGDCSIRISKVNLLDDGLWQCGYPRSDTEPMLKSQNVTLSVYVTPSEPVIVINGIRIGHNEKLFISILNRPPKISCWSENAKPASEIRWELLKDNQIVSTPYFPSALISDSAKYGLKITDLSFNADFDQQWQQVNLTCVATHPSYEKEHRTSVQLILGSEIITTTPPPPPETTTRSFECRYYGRC